MNGDQDGSSPKPSVDAAPPAIAPIIGGADAAKYEYAWQVLLYYFDNGATFFHSVWRDNCQREDCDDRWSLCVT